MGCHAGVWVPALEGAVREVERLIRELRTQECLSAADADLVHSVLRALSFLRKAAFRDAGWPSELAAAVALGARLLASAMRATAQLLQVQVDNSLYQVIKSVSYIHLSLHHIFKYVFLSRFFATHNY